ALISFHFVGCDAERLQKANVLRRHGQLGDNFSVDVRLIERVLIDLNAQRFEKAAIERGELGVLIAGSVAAGQSDGGVQLQHNVVAVRANARDRAGNAVRFRNRIVDGMSQFTEKIFKVIIKLQGSLPYRNCDCRTLISWIQVAPKALSPNGSQTIRTGRSGKSRAPAHPAGTVRCLHGSDKPGFERAAKRETRLSAVLAHAEAVVPRNGWRRIRRAGSGVVAERDSCVDARRFALAGTRGTGSYRTAGRFRVDVLPPRPAASLGDSGGQLDSETDERFWKKQRRRAETGLQDTFRFTARANLQERKSSKRRSCGASGLSRRVSLHPRYLSHDVPQPVVDHAAIRGIRHGIRLQ